MKCTKMARLGHRARLVALVATSLGYTLASIQPARAADKLALIIGNGGYEHYEPLPNAPRDATLVDTSLQKLGYKTTVLTDIRSRDMVNEILKFSKAVSNSPGATVLVYYAGHGFAYRDNNVALPVDFSFSRGRIPASFLVPLDLLISAATAANNGTGILVIDACREFPDFPSTGVTASPFNSRANPERQAYIAYSTSNGITASDGAANSNSPFAIAFVEELSKPSEPVELFFTNVREKVFNRTKSSQLPQGLTFMRSNTAINERPAGLDQQLYYQARMALSSGKDDLGLQLLNESAGLGNGEAMNYLGYVFIKGVSGVKTDISKAIGWYLSATRHNYANAFAALGSIYSNKHTSFYNIQLSYQYLQAGASSGDADSKYLLANALVDGVLPQDVNRAIKLYRESLEAYNCCSAMNLGALYFEGVKVPRNIDEAERLWTLAAARGNPRGWGGLVQIAEARGQYDKAKEFALKEIGAGYARGYSDLGRLVNFSRVSPPTGMTLATLYEAAIAGSSKVGDIETMGYAEALLGIEYYEGKSLPHDIEKASVYMSRGAVHGRQELWSRLGNLELERKDYAKAAGYYTEGLKLGRAECYLAMAWLVINGRVASPQGVTGPDLAKRALELAKQQGNAEVVKAAEQTLSRLQR